MQIKLPDISVSGEQYVLIPTLQKADCMMEKMTAVL